MPTGPPHSFGWQKLEGPKVRLPFGLTMELFEAPDGTIRYVPLGYWLRSGYGGKLMSFAPSAEVRAERSRHLTRGLPGPR